MTGDKSDEYRIVSAVISEVKKALTGKEECIRKVFAAMLAGGHVLIEDVPGVGKTTLAVAFSEALGLKTQRVQFTPDIQPSDIVGFSMYNKSTGNFEYRPGPVMCNLFLADEINRTSPKTQSALLEVMEEGKVTVDGVSRPVPDPFFVIATQNPKGSAGTQLLPESQLDRFMISLTIGYPDIKSEILIAKNKSDGKAEVNSVCSRQTFVGLKEAAGDVFVHNHIYTYIARLVQATRSNPYVELGVSPRGTIATVAMAKAFAYIDERNYVTPKDVDAVFADVCAHRITLGTKARVSGVKVSDVLEETLSSVKKPTTFSVRD